MLMHSNAIAHLLLPRRYVLFLLRSYLIVASDTCGHPFLRSKTQAALLLLLHLFVSLSLLQLPERGLRHLWPPLL